ncbi:hypothetical protein [Chitinophaga japonensis]|uniref:Uncharacterized protein n=1 Tax=Chitinophaga japonensis TaxID=104662 RepID=A0A562SZX2_CHIJA|nr:hypothetical protein [Chitinophaga japonensis]TWI86588.1 hypothetical protein LX66_3847 [Chitinophaga japonensis]
MARQRGPHYITGTYNGICFYRMEGQYYARRKSSLSGKRVKRDPSFTLTMAYANIMAQASQLAAGVYRQLPPARRKHALYRALTGQAMQLLKAGKDAAAVIAALQAACTPPPSAQAPTPPAKTATLLLRLRRSPAPQRTRGKGFCVTPCGRLRPADITAAREALFHTSRRRPVQPHLE